MSSKTIAKLNVILAANAGQFGKVFDKAERKVKGFSASVASTGNIVKGVYAGIIGGVAIVAAKKFIDVAKVQIDAEKKLQAVLTATGGAAGLTADQIGKYAAQLQNVTNFGDEVTIGGAAILATFTRIQGPVFKRALSTMQDMSTIFGTDLKASAIQLGKALNDPLKGVTALSDVGVAFSEEQKAQIKRFMETNNIAGAQGVILNELANEFGGVAKAMADPSLQFQNKVGDAYETIGKELKGITDTSAVFWGEQITKLDQYISGIKNAQGETSTLVGITRNLWKKFETSNAGADVNNSAIAVQRGRKNVKTYQDRLDRIKAGKGNWFSPSQQTVEKQLTEAQAQLHAAQQKLKSAQGRLRAVKGLDVNNLEGKKGNDKAKAEAQSKIDKFSQPEVAKEVQTALDRITKKVAEYGKTEAELGLDILKANNASADQIKLYQEKAAALDALEAKTKAEAEAEKKALEEKTQLEKEAEKRLKEQEDLQSKADAVREDLKTPVDKAVEKIKELNDLQKRGLITEEERRKAIEDIGEGLDTGSRDYTAPELMAVGSAQAQKALYMSKNGFGTDDLPKKQLKELQRQTQLSEAIKDWLATEGEEI